MTILYYVLFENQTFSQAEHFPVNILMIATRQKKKKNSIFVDILQIKVDLPPSYSIFDKHCFWQSVDHVDLPPLLYSSLP